MVCKNCGCPLDKRAKFCENCGAEISPDTLPSDCAENQVQKNVAQLKSKFKTSKAPVIVGIIGVFIGIALIFAFQHGFGQRNFSAGSDLDNAIFLGAKKNGIFEYDLYSNHVVIRNIRDDESLNGKLVIPGELEGVPVTAIDNDSVLGLSCYQFYSVEIPQSVTSIGYNAFKLTVADVIGGEGLRELGAGAFTDTMWLNSQEDEFVMIGDGILLKYNGAEQNIKIPNGVKFIANHCFKGRDVLSISLPASVEKIGDYAFADLETLEQISFTEGLSQIGGAAFKGCKMLQSVELPNSVEIIGSSAFEQCSSLSYVEVPKSTKTIAENAFAETPYFDNLSSEFEIVGDGILIKYNGASSHVDIPDGVKSISAAFRHNEFVESFTIPNSVTQIGRFAFANCTSLHSITIPDSVVHIDYGAFVGCARLRSADLPSSLKEIGPYAFQACKMLQLSIPTGVQTIGKSAFGHCKSLVSISIPDGVQRLYEGTFQYCDSLESVCIPNSVRDIERDTFDENARCVICCSKDGYAYEYANTNILKVAQRQENGTYKGSGMHTGMVWYDYYNEKGQHTKYECYMIDVESIGDDGEAEPGDFVESRDYIYDNTGKLEKRINYNASNDIASYDEYQYDQYGYLYSQQTCNGQGTVLEAIFYDENGDYAATKIFNEFGDLTEYRKVTLDEHWGKEIKMLEIYDAQGQLIKRREID